MRSTEREFWRATHLGETQRFPQVTKFTHRRIEARTLVARASPTRNAGTTGRDSWPCRPRPEVSKRAPRFAFRPHAASRAHAPTAARAPSQSPFHVAICVVRDVPGTLRRAPPLVLSTGGDAL